MSLPDAGLCASCLNARIIENRRGSRFYMCELSKVDSTFARYPPLPVLKCSGYRPSLEVQARDPG